MVVCKYLNNSYVVIGRRYNNDIITAPRVIVYIVCVCGDVVIFRFSPFNQHNFFVNNAKTLVDDNELMKPMFIRILPFGGSSGYFSDMIATGVWYAMLVMIFVIWITKVSK